MSIENIANVIVHREHTGYRKNGEPKFSYSFEWVGDTSWPFLVSGELMRRNPRILQSLPWPTKILHHDKRRDLWIVGRKEAGL